jgi:hypothetical protein
VTNLLCPPALCPPALDTREPALEEGAQLTLLTPMPWAWKILWSMLLSLNSSTDTLPSEEAQASRQPDSWGAQESVLTDAVCSAKS